MLPSGKCGSRQRPSGLKPAAFPGRRVNRRHPGDRGDLSRRQPQRAREDGPRASRPEGGEGGLQGRGLSRDAGDAGEPRHPQAAAGAGGRRPRHEGGRRAGPDPQPETAAPPADLRPPRGGPVTDTEGRRLRNAFADRHRRLGRRHPFGAHVRRSVTGGEGRRPGRVLSGAAAETLPRRGRWTGRTDRRRGRSQRLTAVSSGHPVFPRVASKRLASPAPATAARRPANGRGHIGDTASKGRSGRAKPRRGVCAPPLRKDAREILRGGRGAGRPKPPARSGRGRSAASGRRFPKRFEALAAAAAAVAPREDARRRKRRRVSGSLPAMPFVFRPAAAPRGQGCRTALYGLRERCGAAGVPCRLRDRIPAGSGLFGRGNGREAAHPDRAAGGGVTVCGRGCRSFATAPARRERGPDFAFRVRKAAGPMSGGFTAPGGTERTVTPGAPGDGTAPRGGTLRVRLVKHVAGDTEQRLAASLPDRGGSGIHHGRQGVEGMYGSGKSVTERFHAKSARGDGIDEGRPAMRASFRNGLRTAGRETGALSMQQADAVRQSAARTMAGIPRRVQRKRPGPDAAAKGSRSSQGAGGGTGRPPETGTGRLTGPPASGSSLKCGGFPVRMTEKPIRMPLPRRALMSVLTASKRRSRSAPSDRTAFTAPAAHSKAWNMPGMKVIFRPPDGAAALPVRQLNVPLPQSFSAAPVSRPRPPAAQAKAGFAPHVFELPSSCLHETTSTSSFRIGIPVPSTEKYIRGSGALFSTAFSRPDRAAASKPVIGTVPAMTPAIPGVKALSSRPGARSSGPGLSHAAAGCAD